MNLISKRRHELATAPGVVVTMRALTEKRRISLVLATADDEAELSAIKDRMSEPLAAMEPDIREAKAAVEAKSEDAERLTQALTRNPISRSLVKLHVEAAAVQRRIDEALLRATLISVEGFSVDGVAMGVEGFVEYAPEALFIETLALARQGTGLSEEERGNSESPITSVA